MLTIFLENLRFYAFHGVYAGEKATGGDFMVNLQVDYNAGTGIVRELSQTLNYETLFGLVRQKMETPTPLLETIAMEIAQEILLQFAGAENVAIKIEKCAPPIEGLAGSVAVRYQLSRKDFGNA